MIRHTYNKIEDDSIFRTYSQEHNKIETMPLSSIIDLTNSKIV